MGDFSHRFNPPGALSDVVFSPSMDVYETETSVVVVMELAGVRKENLEVHLDGGTLLVRGERMETCRTAKLRLFRMEIMYGRFERRVSLPAGVVSHGVQAAFEHGVLSIELPKGETGKQAGRISIG